MRAVAALCAGCSLRPWVALYRILKHEHPSIQKENEAAQSGRQVIRLTLETEFTERVTASASGSVCIRCLLNWLVISTEFTEIRSAGVGSECSKCLLNCVFIYSQCLVVCSAPCLDCRGRELPCLHHLHCSLLLLLQVGVVSRPEVGCM